KARSINHGVRPPLTAMIKRPRAAMAARASAAMIAAALRATASSSGWTSITSSAPGSPSALRREDVIRLCRARLGCFRLHSALGFLQVSAEFEPHGRQQLVSEIGLAARAETFVERSRKHGRRHGLVDRGFDRPAPFAGIGDPARKVGEMGVL